MINFGGGSWTYGGGGWSPASGGSSSGITPAAPPQSTNVIDLISRGNGQGGTTGSGTATATGAGSTTGGASNLINAPINDYSGSQYTLDQPLKIQNVNEGY